MHIQTIDLRFLSVDHAIAAFLIRSTDGNYLVECGPSSTLSRLESALAESGVSLSDIRGVFLSHIHFDHAGAAWAFAEKGAQIFVHPRGAAHLASPERLYQSAQQIYGDQMDVLWGPMHPVPEQRIIAPADGEVFDLGDFRMTSCHTPGHAVHHIAWLLESKNHEPVLFTGDAAGVKPGEGGPVMPPCPPPDIDIEAWLESIQYMRRLPVEKLYLTHYGVVDRKNPHFDELEKRLQEWAAWMKPWAEAGAPQAEIVPRFQQWVDQGLMDCGLDEVERSRYEAANPAFMSVAGLMRYWTKKFHKSST